MKLKFLNTITRRIGFSFGVAALVQLANMIITGRYQFEIGSIFVLSLIVFIPVTLLYAIASTFFSDDEKKENDNILDDPL